MSYILDERVLSPDELQREDFSVMGLIPWINTDAPYIDRTLKSEKPADLPVQTAKPLSLDIPTTVLSRADEMSSDVDVQCKIESGRL